MKQIIFEVKIKYYTHENNVWKMCTMQVGVRIMEDTCGVNSLTGLSVAQRHNSINETMRWTMYYLQGTDEKCFISACGVLFKSYENMKWMKKW